MNDGRAVMTLSSPGSPGKWPRAVPGQVIPPVQMAMDRDGPVSFAQQQTPWTPPSLSQQLSGQYDVSGAVQYQVNGKIYQLKETAESKSAKSWGVGMLALGLVTCCAGPACLQMCVEAPDSRYQLEAGGHAVVGVHYSAKGKRMFQIGERVPDGNRIDFSSADVALPVRKDLLAIVVYELATRAAAPTPDASA